MALRCSYHGFQGPRVTLPQNTSHSTSRLPPVFHANLHHTTPLHMLLPLSEILLPILCMANQPLLMLRSQFRGLFTLTPQIWVMAPARYFGAPPIFPLIALTRLHHNPHWILCPEQNSSWVRLFFSFSFNEKFAEQSQGQKTLTSCLILPELRAGSGTP